MKKMVIALLIIIALNLVAGKEINLSSLSTEEKVSQMFIIRGDMFNQKWLEIGIGGIFLNGQKTKENYAEIISKFQDNSKIKLFVATDMEGYWNPFTFYESKNFAQIKTKQEAKFLGEEHGKILKEVGFNLDFSPVVEAKNSVWPGRSFDGSKEEIKEKISAYITALQQGGIAATAKHYPGGNMLKNPHWFKVKASIDSEDLEYFDAAIKNNVSAIMIGHTIVSGAVDSGKKQSTVSQEVISYLRTKQNFSGLIITDDINMLGLKLSYIFKTSNIYVELVKAGNDIILDSSIKTRPAKIKKGIKAIVKAVKNGEISEQRVDDSVERILRAKGYGVVR